MGFHANTFNRSLALDLTLFSFQTRPHENKMQFLGRATGAWISLYSSFKQCHMKTKCNSLAELWRSRKINNQPRMLATSRSPLLPIHFLSSSTIVSVPLLYWLFCRKIEDPLHNSSLQHLQTASAHNCSSVPHHNSAPLLPRVISLHAHSVAATIHSFMYNISHTPRERFPMHFHVVVMERQPSQKEMANKANLTSKIRKCSH